MQYTGSIFVKLLYKLKFVWQVTLTLTLPRLTKSSVQQTISKTRRMWYCANALAYQKGLLV